ncbi:hypothetical protein Calkr_0700 [Caldicellulosiruptor acetigenus I77R1B]|uniref:Uncharacterized protein n=2 Tax=Caldicellulosiruptor acetigenus TaxID=301953 RepID=G2PT82_9FIRM|nr:hypothetical protein [Caldicellulosiruptor acetigenus]ADQ40232.1 hypothetical protein Calkr_0700 [Caldicellulosiruptor acetigenus I77R1B]AEM74241.1 hypothetical protein Calla_1642 [Caldicellulosiruptor acetigenus 6A]
MKYSEFELKRSLSLSYLILATLKDKLLKNRKDKDVQKLMQKLNKSLNDIKETFASGDFFGKVNIIQNEISIGEMRYEERECKIVYKWNNMMVEIPDLPIDETEIKETKIVPVILKTPNKKIYIGGRLYKSIEKRVHERDFRLFVSIEELAIHNLRKSANDLEEEIAL